jgi:hypothetical protein
MNVELLKSLEEQKAHLEFKVYQSKIDDRFLDAEKYECELDEVEFLITTYKQRYENRQQS